MFNGLYFLESTSITYSAFLLVNQEFLLLVSMYAITSIFNRVKVSVIQLVTLSFAIPCLLGLILVDTNLCVVFVWRFVGMACCWGLTPLSPDPLTACWIPAIRGSGLGPAQYKNSIFNRREENLVLNQVNLSDVLIKNKKIVLK